MLPIEIGIKKYQFVDDDDGVAADDASGANDRALANTTKPTAKPVANAPKYKFVNDNDDNEE